MFKHRTRNLLFDRLHKGFVVSCVALTGYGCLLLGGRFYRYFTVTRPTRQLQEIEQQRQLLDEGKDFSGLQDTATELRT